MDTTLIILLGILLVFVYALAHIVSNILKNRSVIYDATTVRNYGVPAYAYSEVALCRVRSQRNFDRIVKDGKIVRGSIID